MSATSQERAEYAGPWMPVHPDRLPSATRLPLLLAELPRPSGTRARNGASASVGCGAGSQHPAPRRTAMTATSVEASVRPVAALFVATGGVYFCLENVEPWDIHCDARKYTGPYPVVAHPPCERWGRYWGGGPSARVKRMLGDDNGCFISALSDVRAWGGVLEHPEASHAWAHFGLNRPPRSGGWVSAGPCGGWTCCVEQGHYGHTARKATWLYACHVDLPELIWGPCTDRQRLDEGFHSKAERDAARAAGIKPRKRLSTRENLSTPIAFRDVLLSIARTARTQAVAA
jgi:hypothetical protein